MLNESPLPTTANSIPPPRETKKVLERAEAHFTHAIAEAGNILPALLGLAAVDFRGRKFEKAQKWYAMAMANYPDTCPPGARVGFGICCYKLGQVDRAKGEQGWTTTQHNSTTHSTLINPAHPTPTHTTPPYPTSCHGPRQAARPQPCRSSDWRSSARLQVSLTQSPLAFWKTRRRAHSRNGCRHYIIATSTTKLTLIHSIRIRLARSFGSLVWLARLARSFGS